MTELKVEILKNYSELELVYNDFRSRATSDYNFELEPLDFNDFVSSLQKELIKCLVLKENDVPVAFLVYTTMISEAIELNIIHSLNMEKFVDRSNYLLREFLNLTSDLRKHKIVCYPMLGRQQELINIAANLGFKFVGIAVLRFMMYGTNSIEILEMAEAKEFPNNYKVISWDEEYFDDAVKIVHEGFETSSDALFDPRFKTLDGTLDILNKITKNVYAEFLPQATSVLLHDDNPVGFCFMNLTGGEFANIPIVSIKKEHQGKGLSSILLKHSMEKIINMSRSTHRNISEVNTCTETDNFQALRMYRNAGFKEDYSYTQSYLPIE